MHATGSESLLLARYGQNNPAIALGRKSWLFAGSERGADRAAFMATLITTAKLNDIDPQARLADVLARLPTGFPVAANARADPGAGSAVGGPRVVQ